MKKKLNRICSVILIFTLLFTSIISFNSYEVTAQQAGTITINNVVPGTTTTHTQTVPIPATWTEVTGWASGQGISGFITPQGLVSINVTAPQGAYNTTIFGELTLTAIDGDGLPVTATWEIVVQTGDRVVLSQPISLEVVTPNTYTQMIAGQPQIIDIRIRNLTTNRGREMMVHIPNQPAGFTTIQAGDTSTFSLNARQDHTIRLQISPNDNVNGSFVIPFIISYEDNLRDRINIPLSIPVQVTRPQVDEARLVMSNFTIDNHNIQAGENFSVTATVSNTGTVVAENVQLSAAAFAPHGFTIDAGGNATHFLGNIPVGQARDVTFNFGSRSDIDTGSYNINFVLRWDGLEDFVTETNRYYVTVFGNDENQDITEIARLQVTSISQPSGTFLAGEVASVSVTIQNNGDEIARNVRITARPDTGIVPRLASIHTLQTIGIGESVTFDFAFSPTAAAITQFYNIGFLVEYATGNTALPEGEFQQFIGMSVYRPDTDEDDDEGNDGGVLSVPRIIVSNYTLEPLIVMANSEFDLFLSFQNTHRDRTIQNIRVNIDVLGTEQAPGGAFTPVGTSNTFFIDEILPRQESHHHMRMFAVPNAEARNHIITISFEYEDAQGNPFTAVENIGVNVQQISRLELGQAMIPDSVSVGEPIDMNFNVQNTGRVTLYNLRIRVEADGWDTSGADRVIGHFTSGSFDFYFGRIIPQTPGDHVVTLVASYHDVMDVLHEIREDFHIHVFDWGGGMDDFPMWDDGDWPMWDDPWGMEEEGEGLLTNPWFWGGTGGVGLVGAGAGGFIFLRKRKHKALDMMGED